MTTGSPVILPVDCLSRRHRAGSAWTDRGTARHISGGPGDWSSSVRCHRRAVELLGGLPVGENAGYLADLGGAWVNLGCALRAGASRDCQEGALAAFEKAIGLLERLPIAASPRFRHNLAAALMNRADALAQMGIPASRADAIGAYCRAIETARGLPLDDKPSFRVLLASCHINLGNLHLSLSSPTEAEPAYEKALEALGELPRRGHRLACHHAATALTNMGDALLQLGARSAGRAVDSARMALAHVEGRRLEGPTSAKVRLLAMRVMARGLEALARGGCAGLGETVAALTDIAERGIDLAFAGRDAAPDLFDPFIVWYFSFGGRVYGRYQPQFLAEYIEEMLRRWDFQSHPGVGGELREVARQALAGALEGLGRNRLIVHGTPQAALLLATVRELRSAAAGLNS